MKNKALAEVAVGDRMSWSDTHAGATVSGVVTGVEHHTQECFDKVRRLFEVSVTVECGHYPAFGAWGTPRSKQATITRRWFKSSPPCMLFAYTPRPNRKVGRASHLTMRPECVAP